MLGFKPLNTMRYIPRVCVITETQLYALEKVKGGHLTGMLLLCVTVESFVVHYRRNFAPLIK